MGAQAIENPSDFLFHPYLQTLLATSVPVDQILLEAEGLGFTPADLLRTAERLIARHSTQYEPLAPLCLVLGVVRRWEPFVLEAKNADLNLLVPVLLSGLEPLEEILGEEHWYDFSRRVLHRLGYPSGLMGPGNSGINPEGALAWLDSGLGLVAHALELHGFTTQAPAWGDFLTDHLVIRDALGPARVTFFPQRTPGAHFAPMVPAFPGSYGIRDEGSCARFFRVRGLRAMVGLENNSTLVAVDCPELESLDVVPPTLVLRNCPNLSQMAFPWWRKSLLLHLDRCPRIRSLPEAVQDIEIAWESTGPGYGTVVLEACTALRELPNRWEVTGELYLRQMGPIEKWPLHFRIGGDFRLRDCPEIEELPVMEVSGSLLVEGASGLRRLSPGTVVGENLDLRACRHLEGIPRGVEVGGSLYLPEHLLCNARWESPAPILAVSMDHYPDLRILLISRHFSELAKIGERSDLNDHAQVILENLQQELRENPSLVAELIWTASDVWRDLAVERWGRDLSWSEEGNDSDEDLPLAWFRGLLLGTSAAATNSGDD